MTYFLLAKEFTSSQHSTMKLGATIFAFLAGPGIVASSPENNPKLTCVSYDADLTSEGCYVDSGSPRTLTGTGGNFDANTPQACGDYCGRLGYKYAGVEYSRLVKYNSELNQSDLMI